MSIFVRLGALMCGKISQSELSKGGKVNSLKIKKELTDQN
jgi:hypothetical protein